LAEMARKPGTPLHFWGVKYGVSCQLTFRKVDNSPLSLVSAMSQNCKQSVNSLNFLIYPEGSIHQSPITSH